MYNHAWRMMAGQNLESTRKSGRLLLNYQLKKVIGNEVSEDENLRLTEILKLLNVPFSTFYRPVITSDKRRKSGPKTLDLPKDLIAFVESMALTYDRRGCRKLFLQPINFIFTLSFSASLAPGRKRSLVLRKVCSLML